MKSRVPLLLIAMLTTILPACEKWSWPPYESSLRDLFTERQNQFEEIRQNMLADDLELMTSAHARGRNRVRAGLNPPIISKELQTKYSALVEERSAFRYNLHGDVFAVYLSVPPAQGRDFSFWFVRAEIDVSMPECGDKKSRLPRCGACYSELDPNWSMHWSWTPQDLGPDWDGSVGDGKPTVDEIQGKFEKALDDCLAAGKKEMGVDTGD